MFKLLITIKLIILMSTVGSAQLPTTDIFQFKIFNNGERISIRNPIYLSGMNPGGYNNQPSFSSPDKLLITSNLYDSEFTELISLDLLNNEFTRLTQTDSISEYSPTPNAIDNYYSTIRVEKDGFTQSLFLYPNDHSNGGKRVLKDLSNIGYHHWLSDNELALFLDTDPVSLIIANIKDNTSEIVSENIGRCIKMEKDGNLIYVHKLRSDLWYIKSYDLESKESNIVVQTLPGSEDFEILPDGTFIMGNGSTIHSMHPDKSDTWKEEVDLYQYGITNITRLSTSRNKLVLVNKK